MPTTEHPQLDTSAAATAEHHGPHLGHHELHLPIVDTTLVFGLVARVWLWFLGSCLVVAVLPAAFGWGTHVVMSGSMSPAIRPGDIVVASPFSPGTDVDGRIVVIGREGMAPVVHRVVGIDEQGRWITRGDANAEPDSTPVTAADIDGIARVRVPWIGTGIQQVRDGSFVFITLLLTSIALAAWAVIRDRDPEHHHAHDHDHDHDHDRHDHSDPPDRGSFAGQATGVIAVALLVLVAVAPMTRAAFSQASPVTSSSWTVRVSGYTGAVLLRTPSIYWKLDEASGTANAADTSPNGVQGVYLNGPGPGQFTVLTPGAISQTGNRARFFRNNNSCLASAPAVAARTGSQTFSIAVWFRAPTTFTDGGRIVAFDTLRTGSGTGTAGRYDRTVYMDGSGRLRFAVWSGGSYQTLASPASVNNGQWRLAVATLSPSGMALYLDGALLASNPAVTSASAMSGWWRAGCGNAAGLPWSGANAPSTSPTADSNRVFNADLDEIAMFDGIALTAADVAALWAAR